MFETLSAGVDAGGFDAKVVWSLDGPRSLKFDEQVAGYLWERRKRSDYGKQLYGQFDRLVEGLNKVDKASKQTAATPSP